MYAFCKKGRTVSAEKVRTGSAGHRKPAARTSNARRLSCHIVMSFGEKGDNRSCTKCGYKENCSSFSGDRRHKEGGRRIKKTRAKYLNQQKKGGGGAIKFKGLQMGKNCKFDEEEKN